MGKELNIHWYLMRCEYNTIELTQVLVHFTYHFISIAEKVTLLFEQRPTLLVFFIILQVMNSLSDPLQNDFVHPRNI